MAWWNGLTEPQRSCALEAVGDRYGINPSPADAFAHFVEPRPSSEQGVA